MLRLGEGPGDELREGREEEVREGRVEEVLEARGVEELEEAGLMVWGVADLSSTFLSSSMVTPSRSATWARLWSLVWMVTLVRAVGSQEPDPSSSWPTTVPRLVTAASTWCDIAGDWMDDVWVMAMVTVLVVIMILVLVMLIR